MATVNELISEMKDEIMAKLAEIKDIVDPPKPPPVKIPEKPKDD